MAPATLTDLLEATAARRPDAPALQGYSYAQMAARVRRIAGGLAAQGIGPGDRVALFLPNRPSFLLLLFALARRGATAVLLNTRFRAGELAPLLARAEASAIAIARDFAPADPAPILAALPRGGLRFAIGADDGAPGEIAAGGVGDIAGLPLLPLAALDADAPDLATPDSEALTFTTSGTTAGPKLVLHRQASLAHHAQAVAARIGTDAPGATCLAAVPLCGTFGLSLALAGLAGGAAIAMLERFDAASADALIRAKRITHMVGGDDLLLKLAEAAGGRPYAPFAFTGFAAFHGQAPAVMEASRALNLAARGVYGSSEAQALFALQDPDGPHAAIGGGLPASAEAAFRIDAEGALWLRGPSLFDRYLGDAPATARARDAAGWFRSGDLASPQPGGGFAFLTRLGDALRLGGFLVAPEEIEAFLAAQPGVAAAQVVEAAGRPVAFVLPAAGFDADAVLAAARRDLAGFKVPARLVPLEAFPIVDGPNGPKVQRATLRAWAAA
jgi:fatty-acyl-CoA synthase